MQQQQLDTHAEIFGGDVTVHEGRVDVKKESAIASAKMDTLVRAAVFIPGVALLVGKLVAGDRQLQLIALRTAQQHGRQCGLRPPGW